MKRYVHAISILLAFGVFAAAATDALAKKRKKRRKKRKKANTEETMTYRAPYGMAGCGLGTYVFKENNKMQILASTTNATGIQTFGITTGTSNCKESSDMAQIKMEQEVFVSANLRSLSKDAAQGEGRYLRAFAEVLGCTDGQQYDAFVDASRSNFDAIFSSDEPKAVLDNYLTVVRADDRLSACQRVGV